ncbi:MAG: hypothetical protein H6552_06960 [Chitinophagales bacterium]|nr:hypothetical protein [Bacteroidota bacterium]MCB9075258.1 hypothetical protein [Chitinophagales bacterium]
MRIFAIFNQKIALWFRLQKDWKSALNKANSKDIIWFHVASVGEFEMAIPIIKQIKSTQHLQKIVVSFFSTSGISFYSPDETIDYFFLYPKDYKKNVNFILENMQPKCLIIVKNERWLNLVQQTYLKKIPIYQVEVEQKKHAFVYQQYLNYFQQFIKKTFYIKNGSLQIESVKNTEKINLPIIQEFTSNHFTIILGSCYIEEVKLISSLYNKHTNLKIILCPHEINHQTFDQYQSFFKGKISKYSDLIIESNILFIDKMGILKHIYPYTQIAFIGGGFYNKLHNIFEAAIYNNIILTGNKINRNYLNSLADETQLIHKIENLGSLEFIISKAYNSPNFMNVNKEKWNNFFNLHQNTAQFITETILSDL